MNGYDISVSQDDEYSINIAHDDESANGTRRGGPVASKIAKVPLVYQSIQSSFSSKVFILETLFQLMPHVMGIFSNFFGFNLYLHGFRIPFSFTIVWFIEFIANHLTPLISYLMVISYLMISRVPKEGQCMNEGLFRGCHSDFTPVSGSIAIPLCCLLLHRVIVALKYACLSPSEFEAINSDCKNEEDRQNIQNQIQTISAWTLRTKMELIKFEIASSAILSGVDLSTIYFVVESPKKLSKSAYSQWMNWKRFLHTAYKTSDESSFENFDTSPYLKPKENGDFIISLLDVSVAVMQNVTERGKIQHPQNFHRPQFTGILRTFTFILILIPLFFLIQLKVVGFWVIIYLVTSTILTGLFFNFSFQFVGQTFLDSNRRIEEAKILRSMMRVADVHITDNIDGTARTFGPIIVALKNVHTYHDYSENLEEDDGWGIADNSNLKSDAQSSTNLNNRKQVDFVFAEKRVKELFYESNELSFVPKLYIDNNVGPLNILAWTNLCQIMRNSGDRFISKFGYYLLMGIIIGSVSVGIIITILSNPSEDLAKGSFRLLSPLFFQSIVLSIFIFIIVILTAFSAAQVNLEYSRHRHILQCNLLNLEDKNVKSSDGEKKNEKTIHALEVSDGAIALLSDLRPYTFITVPATFSFVATLVSVIMSLVSTIIGIYFKNYTANNT